MGNEGLEAIELEGEHSSGWNGDSVARALGLAACLLAIALIVLVLDVRSLVQADRPDSAGMTAADGRVLVGPDAEDDADEERVVVSLVLGQARSEDGVTFGEFIKQRIASECDVPPGVRYATTYRWTSGDPTYSVVVNP